VRCYVELGRKRVFAAAVDWPGWCRSAPEVGAALEALRAYAPRYGVVAARAGLAFPAAADPAAIAFEVVEEVAGSSTTDFGAPGAIPQLDAEPLDAEEADRCARLLEASWSVFDAVVAGAPATLRKGPRGGGRDRDQIVDHVEEAEQVYARKLGIRHREVDSLREAVAEVVRAAPGGTTWPVRYAARRIAWHVLDHAWEIDDRSS
jgi:hypothetical protein